MSSCISRLQLLAIIPTLALFAGCSTAPDFQSDPRDDQLSKLLDLPHDEAAKKLDEELSKSPNSLHAQYFRAAAEAELGDAEDGITRLTKLIDKYPTYAFSYAERARANTRAGHYDEALADANEAIRYRSDVPRFYVRRALANLVMHHPDKTLEDLKKATKLNPTEDASYINVLTGSALMEMHRYKEALPILTSEIGRNDCRTYVKRADCYAHLKQWKEATADSEKALQLNPKDTDAQIMHEALLSATGQRAEARTNLAKLIKSGVSAGVMTEVADLGTGTTSIADAALAALSVGDAKYAKEILDKTEARRPLEPEELFALAKTELAGNDLFRAAKHLNECLAIEPTWAEPRIELIKLYIKDNLPEKAREVQREGLKLPLSATDRKNVAAAV